MRSEKFIRVNELVQCMVTFPDALVTSKSYHRVDLYNEMSLCKSLSLVIMSDGFIL